MGFISLLFLSTINFFATVLMQVEPSVIITSSKADARMQKVINEYGMSFKEVSLIITECIHIIMY